VIRVEGLTKWSAPRPGPSAAEGHVARAAAILRDVTLTVPEATLYGLMGPGASGKSVLLKMLAGLLRPDAGSIRIGDHAVTGASELELHDLRKRIGMLFQNNALFDHLTVFDNIAFPLRRLYAPPEDEVRERVAERLACVSLPGFEARMPASLSGGQKKRIGVARATVTRAPIVFYDEPAAGLDPVTSQKIFDLLRAEQRAMGATVVMVSSDLDRLLTVTDRVGMLYRGELLFDGTTDEARASVEPRVRQFVHGLTEGPL
jgi:phospholipid/cholesterol/gamma-HCH transport system ATP-binding protein